VAGGAGAQMVGASGRADPPDRPSREPVAHDADRPILSGGGSDPAPIRRWPHIACCGRGCRELGRRRAAGPRPAYRSGVRADRPSITGHDGRRGGVLTRSGQTRTYVDVPFDAWAGQIPWGMGYRRTYKPT
jgi:hypothetical protein